MTTEDPFRYDDAAYVLGALSDDERRAFEEHLRTCDECTARVREIEDVPLLLADVPAPVDEPVPDTLLPALLRTARNERRRRRIFAGAGSLVAAAAITVLAVVAADSGSSGNASTPAAARNLTPLVSTPVHASAALVAKDWGTSISLTCRYDASYRSGTEYSLVVTDRSGRTHPAGTWTLDPGETMHFTGGTSVPESQISSVEVVGAANTPLLQLTL